MGVACIVCGRKFGYHDGEYHARYKAEYKATAHLQRRSWPRLRGLPPRGPAPTRGDLRWYARVMPGGDVLHVPVKPGERGYEEAA